MFFGLLDLHAGTQALFGLTSRDTLQGVLLLLVYSFSLLPTALIAIRRPGFAALLATISALAFLFFAAILTYETRATGQPLEFNPTPILLFFLPVTIAAGGFAYVARATKKRYSMRNQGSDGEVFDEANERLWQVKWKWAAAAVGFLLSASLAPMTIHVGRIAREKGDWPLFVGLLTVAGGPLLITIVSFMRVSWATIGAFAYALFSLVFFYSIVGDFYFVSLVGPLIEIPALSMCFLFYRCSRLTNAKLG